jgi:hypothetical protein
MGGAAHLMTDTVYIKSYDGTRQNSGDPNFGAQTSIAARAERIQKLVMAADGNEKMSESRIISESEIVITDMVWPPWTDETDDNDSKQPIAVGRASTPGGYTLYEAWL